MTGIITKDEILEASWAIRQRSEAAVPGDPTSHEEADQIAAAVSSGIDVDPDALVKASLEVVPVDAAAGFCTGVTVGLEIAARRARSEANDDAKARD